MAIRRPASRSHDSSTGPPPLEIGTHLSDIAARLKLDVVRGPEVTTDAPSSATPTISVVVPVHNDDRFVGEALESVRRQSYANWECVVVDDASSDDSWPRIREAVAEDGRFRAYRSTTNLGPGGARNLALSHTEGEYIAFLDGDDLLMTASLLDRVEALGGSHDDPFLTGSFCGVRMSPESVRLDDLASHYRSDQPPFVDFVVADGEVPFPMTAALVRAERVQNVGGFDESMRDGGVDWDLWYRILRNGYVFVGSPFQSVVYRQRPGGITRGHPARHTAASAALIRRAHQAEGDEILSDPSPYPMVRALGDYRAILKVAERAVRFAAMALVDGDIREMQAVLSVLDKGTHPLLERHLDLTSLVRRGAARSMGLRPSDLEGFEGELSPFVAWVARAVEAASR